MTTAHMSIGMLEAASAKATVFLAEQVEFGNIGTNNVLFKPIFQGGIVIMFSGVLAAFVVAQLIDKFDLYERLSNELEG